MRETHSGASTLAALARSITASTSLRSGASEQTGSVALALPVSSKAWQRQPPKSSWRRSQLRHGSGIQSSPRKRRKAADSSQIQRSGRDWTFSNVSSGITPALLAPTPAAAAPAPPGPAPAPVMMAPSPAGPPAGGPPVSLEYFHAQLAPFGTWVQVGGVM